MKMMSENPVIYRPEVSAAIERILSRVQFGKNEPLPCLTLSPFDRENLTVSFFLLAEDYPGAGAFFYEIITRSLLPGRQLETALFFLCSLEEGRIVSELAIKFKTAQQWEEARRSYEILQEQIQIGLRSPYHAARIQELKGMSVDEKRVGIQERATKAIHRFPEYFDYDLFSLVQHYFATAHQEFFRFHEARQVSQNLLGFYLMRKRMVGLIEEDPLRRHLSVKVKKRHLHDPLGTREVLGVTVGLNFLGDHELFSQKHLFKAIERLLPESTSLAESEYLYEDPHHPFHLLYLEIEAKSKGARKLLLHELPIVLKGRIERLQRPLFMPHNEEEVMRHVITLGNQLKFARDLPQIIISFSQQNDAKLFFKVILARILLPEHEPAESLLRKLKPLRPQVERSRKMGVLRKKHCKEALVFKLEVPLIDFLRDDQSVDLYAARRFILGEIEEVFGEVRDYNGGMISKQNEVLNTLHSLLGEAAVKHRLLLENFFHAIFPVEKRGLVDPHQLHQLFLLLLEHLEEGKEGPLSYRHQGKTTYLLTQIQGRMLKEEILKLPSQMGFSSPLISLQLVLDEHFFIGFIVPEKGKKFCEKIRFLSQSGL